MAAEAAQHSARVTPTKVKVGTGESFFEQGFDVYRTSSGGSAGSSQSPRFGRGLDDFSFDGVSPGNVTRRSPGASPNRPGSTSPDFSDLPSEDAALCDFPIATAVFSQDPSAHAVNQPSNGRDASCVRSNHAAVRLCRQCGRTEADAAAEQVPLRSCPLCRLTFCDWCCRNEVVIRSAEPDDTEEHVPKGTAQGVSPAATNAPSARTARSGSGAASTTSNSHGSSSDDETPPPPPLVSTCVVCDECYGNSPAVTFEQPPNLRELALQVGFYFFVHFFVLFISSFWTLRVVAQQTTIRCNNIADTLCGCPPSVRRPFNVPSSSSPRWTITKVSDSIQASVRAV